MAFAVLSLIILADIPAVSSYIPQPSEAEDHLPSISCQDCLHPVIKQTPDQSEGTMNSEPPNPLLQFKCVKLRSMNSGLRSNQRWTRMRDEGLRTLALVD